MLHPLSLPSPSPLISSGSEPGTPLLSRKDSAGLRHLKAPKVVESMMAERRAERRRREEEEKTPPPVETKTSEDLEADEILRWVPQILESSGTP